ncbi:MAG TPA: hypothetical protein EYP07_12925 [Kiloniellaceae bacterium]|nr:hypothetical protein [Kiloniellaceae bacterium]
MAKILNPNDTLRFSPSSQDEVAEAERLTFLLRVPTLYTRAKLEKAIRSQGGREVTVWDWLRTAERGLKEIAEVANDDEAMSEYIAAIQARRTALLAADNAEEMVEIMLTRDEDIEAAAELLRSYYPPLNELEANQSFYATCVGIEAARLLLVGWENGPAKFRSGKAGVPESVLEQASEADLVELGKFIQEQLRPTPAEAKNSDSPSPTGSSETNSISEATAKTSRRSTPCKAGKPGTSKKSASPA